MTSATTVLDSWMRGFGRVTHEHRSELTGLDSSIGDADHGANLSRGMDAVIAKLDSTSSDTPGDLLKTVGMTLVSTVGGASGPLYGTFFLRLGTSLGADDELDPARLGEALRAGVEGVVARGRAEVGDKTMIDALMPALDAWDAAASDGRSLTECANAAYEAAQRGRDATEPLVAKKGRASYLGERSAGHIDPGAASSALLLGALHDALAEAS